MICVPCCLRNRNLTSGNLDPEDRKSAIVRRQYVDNKPAYEAANNANKKRSSAGEDPELEFLEGRKGLKMMKLMGYDGVGALGKTGQGIRSSVLPSNQIGNRGIGFSSLNPIGAEKGES